MLSNGSTQSVQKHWLTPRRRRYSIIRSSQSRALFVSSGELIGWFSFLFFSWELLELQDTGGDSSELISRSKSFFAFAIRLLAASILSHRLHAIQYKQSPTGTWVTIFATYSQTCFKLLRTTLHYGQGTWPQNHEDPWNSSKGCSVENWNWKCMVMGLHFYCKHIRERALNWILVQYHPLHMGPSTKWTNRKEIWSLC